MFSQDRLSGSGLHLRWWNVWHHVLHLISRDFQAAQLPRMTKQAFGYVGAKRCHIPGKQELAITIIVACSPFLRTGSLLGQDSLVLFTCSRLVLIKKPC